MNFPLYPQSDLEEESKTTIFCTHFEFFLLFFLDQLSRVAMKNNLISFPTLPFIAAVHICILPYLCSLMGLLLIYSNSEHLLSALAMIKVGSCKTVLF